MKKTLLFIALVLGASNMTFAQANKTNKATNANAAATMTPEERIDQRIKNMTENLGLNAQQQASIKQILQQGHTSMKAAKDAKDRTKAESIKNNVIAQVEAVLTHDQKLKFEKSMAEAKAKKKDVKKS